MGAVLEESYAGRDALRAWKRAALEEGEILRRVAPQNDRKGVIGNLSICFLESRPVSVSDLINQSLFLYDGDWVRSI